MPGILWCSASQNRLKPSSSTHVARDRVLRNDSEAEPPAITGDKSSTDNGILESLFIFYSSMYRHIDGYLYACQTKMADFCLKGAPNVEIALYRASREMTRLLAIFRDLYPTGRRRVPLI